MKKPPHRSIMSKPTAAAPIPPHPAGKLIDPQALMAIRDLELRAKVVVEGFWTGLHRSPYHGFSVEFTEYRQYTAGDDLRYLDWRVFARSDRYYIKKFEDETNLRCYLLVDHSRSMTYGSRGYSKADYANTLAATASYFLYHQGDAVGLMTFAEQVGEYLPARHRTGHLRHLMLALERPPSGTGTDVLSPLERIVEIVKKRSLIVLISDLLAPVDLLDRRLSALVASGHEVLLFQVLDPAELELSLEQPVMLEDIESGREMYIDPVLAREEYTTKLRRHVDGIRSTCRKLGISFYQLSTDHSLELMLFDFLRDRMQRGRRIKRTGQTRSVSAAAA
jgi:uncharacterized protein (DUF58 family)